ncbi:hypothetical protein BN1708_007179 [Verticillium longisporum]|uniref:Uncharacterized protein n=1 Tax=Verticillium longisporum TaxID=100787 RepID=A0A0G4MR30_VERLO|nr:hypothetical protein BN1708_007179 [Verticillium longisporum]
MTEPKAFVFSFTLLACPNSALARRERSALPHREPASSQFPVHSRVSPISYRSESLPQPAHPLARLLAPRSSVRIVILFIYNAVLSPWDNGTREGGEGGREKERRLFSYAACIVNKNMAYDQLCMSSSQNREPGCQAWSA